MPQANLTSVHTLNMVIPVGDNESQTYTVSHGLVDQEGNHLTPDRITEEIASVTAPGPGPAVDPCTWSFLKMRSSPEDGTFGVRAFLSDINNTGDNVHITLYLVCEYFHSIQSDEHFPSS